MKFTFEICVGTLDRSNSKGMWDTLYRFPRNSKGVVRTYSNLDPRNPGPHKQQRIARDLVQPRSPQTTKDCQGPSLTQVPTNNKGLPGT